MLDTDILKHLQLAKLIPFARLVNSTLSLLGWQPLAIFKNQKHISLYLWCQFHKYILQSFTGIDMNPLCHCQLKIERCRGSIGYRFYARYKNIILGYHNLMSAMIHKLLLNSRYMSYMRLYQNVRWQPCSQALPCLVPQVMESQAGPGDECMLHILKYEKYLQYAMIQRAF